MEKEFTGTAKQTSINVIISFHHSMFGSLKDLVLYLTGHRPKHPVSLSMFHIRHH